MFGGSLHFSSIFIFMFLLLIPPLYIGSTLLIFYIYSPFLCLATLHWRSLSLFTPHVFLSPHNLFVPYFCYTFFFTPHYLFFPHSLFICSLYLFMWEHCTSGESFIPSTFFTPSTFLLPFTLTIYVFFFYLFFSFVWLHCTGGIYRGLVLLVFVSYFSLIGLK